MLIDPAPQFLDVPVRPLFFGNRWFHRSTRFIGFSPRQNPDTGEMSVVLEVAVRHFHVLADGSQGASAQELIPLREHYQTYRADNSEAVDLRTGEVVELTQGHLSSAAYDAVLQADPRPLMRRGNAFRTMFYNLPEENQLEMIANAMRLADNDLYGRFGNGPLQVPADYVPA